MASAADYATWLVQNEDKAGTPEFETVAQAYRAARNAPSSTPPPPVANSRLPKQTMEEAMLSRAYSAPTEMGMGGLTMDEAIAAQRTTATAAARVGLPVAASIAFPPSAVGLLPSIGIGAGAAAVGEGIGQGIEGRFSGADVAKAAVVGSVPQLPLASASAGAAFARLANFGAPVGAMAVAEATGETLRRSIEKGEFSTYESLSEAGRGVAIPAAIGGVFGALNQAKAFSQGRTQRMQLFKQEGINPTLDMIAPKYAELGAKVRQFSPDAMNELIEAERPLVETFSKLFPEAVTNERIRSELAPYLGKLDTQKQIVAEAKRRASEVRRAYADAAQRLETAPQRILELRDMAVAAEMNAVNQRARLMLQAQQTFGPVASNTATAQQTKKLIEDFRDLRKARSDELFGRTGINPEEPLFLLGDIRLAAKSGLANKASTDAAKRVLATIDSLQDPTLGARTPLTLNQVRELRGLFSKQFEGLNPKDLNVAESIAAAGYQSVLRSTERQIGRISPDALTAYKEAVGYYAQTAEAMNSRYAKAILNNEPLDSVFASLGDDIASGNVAEVQALNKFLSAVTPEAPEVAKMAQAQFAGAIRNSVLNAARGEFGDIDPRKLVSTLTRFPEEVPVESLGFGSKEFLRDWARTFREYGVKSVNREILEESFNSPAFQTAILAGRPARDAARPVAAKLAFGNDVRMRLLESAAGIRSDLKQLGRAQKLARDAGMDELQQRRLYDAIEADPIMREFAGGETFGVSRTASGGSKEIINAIINAGERGVRFLRTVRNTRPELGELIESRYMAEKMREFFRPATSRPGAIWEVDKREVEKFFNNVTLQPLDTPEGMAKAFITPERLDRFKRAVRVFSEIIDIGKRGSLAAHTSNAEVARAFGMSEALVAGRGITGATMQATGFQKIGNWINSGRWRMLSAMIGDTKFANAVWKADGDLQKAFEAIGPGRAYLLQKQFPTLAEQAEEEGADEWRRGR